MMLPRQRAAIINAWLSISHLIGISPSSSNSARRHHRHRVDNNACCAPHLLLICSRIFVRNNAHNRIIVPRYRRAPLAAATLSCIFFAGVVSGRRRRMVAATASAWHDVTLGKRRSDAWHHRRGRINIEQNAQRRAASTSNTCIAAPSLLLPAIFSRRSHLLCRYAALP